MKGKYYAMRKNTIELNTLKVVLNESNKKSDIHLAAAYTERQLRNIAKEIKCENEVPLLNSFREVCFPHDHCKSDYVLFVKQFMDMIGDRFSFVYNMKLRSCVVHTPKNGESIIKLGFVGCENQYAAKEIYQNLITIGAYNIKMSVDNDTMTKVDVDLRMKDVPKVMDYIPYISDKRRSAAMKLLPKLQRVVDHADENAGMIVFAKMYMAEICNILMLETSTAHYIGRISECVYPYAIFSNANGEGDVVMTRENNARVCNYVRKGYDLMRMDKLQETYQYLGSARENVEAALKEIKAEISEFYTNTENTFVEFKLNKPMENTDTAMTELNNFLKEHNMLMVNTECTVIYDRKHNTPENMIVSVKAIVDVDGEASFVSAY